MNNAQIAAVLAEVADLLDFRGENPFRVRAYRNAARVVQDLPEPAARLAADPDRSLTDLPGIGADLAEKIHTLCTTGHLPLHEELLGEVPQSVLALLRIPGLGPRKAATLFQELGVRTLADLRAACEAHRVRDLKGFGAKTEQTILAGIPLAESAHDRIYWAEADQFVQELLAYLGQVPEVEQLAPAGSYRRGRETIGDLDLLAVARTPDAVMQQLADFPNVEQVLARGETKMSVRLAGGLQVDLRVVPEESFGAALQYFTGSKEHNVVLRGLAKERGLKINEYGVFRVQGDQETYLAGRTEEEVYAALGLPCIPPELREARREFDWAAAGALPVLVELEDLRGDLHLHTTASDGTATLEQMAAAARARGLEYIAVTDHSKRVTMANGLDGPRLRLQWAAIDRLNEQLSGFTVLKGVEVDILEKGGLDLADDVLRGADWVVASVHYGQNQSRDQITRRIVDALANPYVSAIAHPTGRLLNRRAAYEVDLAAVFRAARQHGKLLELNANPARLDLDDQASAAAQALGVPIVISTDAHSVEGLGAMRYGVLQARRGGLTRRDVANTRSWPELRQLLPPRP
jgi:DNA polymerase (family 10)